MEDGFGVSVILMSGKKMSGHKVAHRRRTCVLLEKDNEVRPDIGVAQSQVFARIATTGQQSKHECGSDVKPAAITAA
jgi:hypothetical protein